MMNTDPVGVTITVPQTFHLPRTLAYAVQKLAKYDRIQAIKVVRAELGVGLKEAKDITDRLADQFDISLVAEQGYVGRAA